MDNNDNENNNFIKLLAVLLLTSVLCACMFYLPDRIGGIDVKRVDLLSDLRRKEASNALMDSLRAQLLMEDSVEMALSGNDTLTVKDEELPPEVLAERDSLYALYNAAGRDSTLIPFEDYSNGHVGLRRFFKALKRTETEGGTVRVGFMGDSFIEGDIVVGDFRNEMQKRFGGKGVGLVPIASVAATFRPTVTAKESGWTIYSILKEKTEAYTPLGCFFRPSEEEASVSMTLTGYYPTLSSVEGVKLLYSSDNPVEAVMVTDGDTTNITLPSTNGLSQYAYKKNGLRKADFIMKAVDGFSALGVVMEDEHGVSVDNFSIRGNSGLVLELLDKEQCERLNEERPYDLLVLQYGLNVANDSTLSYSWYAQKMVPVIEKLKNYFPNADIVLMGVSDRSRQNDGEFETMPAVLSLLHSQRKLAKQTGVVFWNTFAAMGGENSMARFVDKNWAAKDYTHISFRGGREISSALVKAVLHEKKFYDEID